MNNLISDFDRRILKLRYQCRWPLRRIAAVTKVSISQVSRRLARFNPNKRKYRQPKFRYVRPISLSDVWGEI